MEQSPKTTGRMELAQRYFPNILPHSAWKKFKSLLEEESSLCRLSTQRHLHPCRSKQNLPIPRKTLNSPISGHFSRFPLNRNASALPLTIEPPSAYD